MENYTMFAGFSKAIPHWKPVCVLIRWAEAPKFFSLFPASHVFAVYPSHDEKPFYMVNEAAGAMIRWVSQPHFERNAEIVALYKLKLPKLHYHRAKHFGELYSGAPYALWENLGILIVRVVNAFGFRLKNPFGKGARTQKCSELVMRTVLFEFFQSQFGDEFTVKTLQTNLMNDRGYYLPIDVDVMGVADLFEVFEWLADKKLIDRVSVSHEMKIAA